MRCASVRLTAAEDRSAQARWAARTVADGAGQPTGLRGPAFGCPSWLQLTLDRQEHGWAVVVVGSIVMVVICRVPMPALFHVPSRMIGFHRKLAGTMGEGREDRRERKRTKEHKCCHPRQYDPCRAHLPPQCVNLRPIWFYPPRDSVAGLWQHRTTMQASRPSVSVKASWCTVTGGTTRLRFSAGVDAEADMDARSLQVDARSIGAGKLLLRHVTRPELSPIIEKARMAGKMCRRFRLSRQKIARQQDVTNAGLGWGEAAPILANPRSTPRDTRPRRRAADRVTNVKHVCRPETPHGPSVKARPRSKGCRSTNRASWAGSAPNPDRSMSAYRHGPTIQNTHRTSHSRVSQH